MSEAALWRRLRKAARGHWVRVENAAEIGTPDVNFCIDGVEGWIELKHVEAAPIRPDTQVNIGLSREQRDWLVERAARGGRAFVLVQIGREVMLFRAQSAFALWIGMPIADLRDLALCENWSNLLEELRMK